MFSRLRYSIQGPPVVSILVSIPGIAIRDNRVTPEPREDRVPHPPGVSEYSLRGYRIATRDSRVTPEPREDRVPQPPGISGYSGALRGWVLYPRKCRGRKVMVTPRDTPI